MSVKFDYKIDFQSVLVGTQASQTLPIDIVSKGANWTIIQKPDFCTSLNAFVVKKKVSKLDGKDKHEIIVEYKPLQPNQTHVNCYLIKNASDNDLILHIKGYSLGLRVQASVKHINFYQLKNDFKTKTVFELQNKSKCKVIFQFDIDNNQKIFEIDPVIGEILPGKYVYISAKFLCENQGVYFLDLPCLVHFQQPIYIELLGVNSMKATENHLKEIRGQISKITLENGFEKYMTETFGSINFQPIISINPRCLEFALEDVQKNPVTLNHIDKCIQIIWDVNPEMSCNVFPERFYLRPTERNAVEIKFQPKVLEKFYGGQIYGRGFVFEEKQDQDSPETLIFSLSLRYIGNTFSKTKKWTPSVDIYPKNIFMPVCIKNKEVYTTFVVKKFGDYPVTFKVLPPKKTSNFRVKPMIGIIDNSFQIFVVKFSSGAANNSQFQELWTIEFNQQKHLTLEITFNAVVQEPKVLLGQNDQIDFGTVFPGCKKYLTVPFFNKTQNTIKFYFKNNQWFTVEPAEGDLDSFESLELEWCYTADCDVAEKTILCYEIRVMDETKLVSGKPYVESVEIFAKSAFGQICSSPSRHDFQTVVCGVPMFTSFTLYNFSEVTLHFLLRVHEHYGMSEEAPIDIKPCEGSLAPGGHIEVSVRVLTYLRCLSTYCIKYYLRQSERTNELIENIAQTFSTSGTIFQIDYFSFYPTLRFIEIGQNTTGPLFGKVNVWEYFHMDGFNELLRTIRMDEVRHYSVRVPDAEAELNISKSIMFILKNVTREPTICRFERKKICSCALKEVQNTSRIGSVRKYTYEDCPHRKILSITTSEEEVKAYTNIFVTITINYILFDEQDVCFLMHLSHNRVIEVIFHVRGLKPSQLSTYSNGFNLKMNSVYIGELNPDLQIFWFLNNTRTAANYYLDLGPLRKYNSKWGHPILMCLNPEGFVEAKSLHYIEFFFAPIAEGPVQFELPFQFGSIDTTLKIVGMARKYYISPLEQLYFTELGKDYVKLNDLLVNISTEHIVIRAFPAHCSTTRILTLRNVSANSKIGFSFDTVQLEGTINIWMRPASGLLAPGERIALVLHVSTGGVACALRTSMSCHLVDHTNLQKHINTTTEFHRQTDSRNDQFCIGENGIITYPEVPTVEIYPAPKVFHRTIAITTHIIPHVDLDTKMTIQDQLKQTPFKMLRVYNPITIGKYLIPRAAPERDASKTSRMMKNITLPSGQHHLKCTKKCCIQFSDDEYVAVHTVLSCILHDLIMSKKFKHFIHVLNEGGDRYYTEFNPQNFSEAEEKENVERLVNRIPDNFLSETMQVLLADSIFKEFQLGQYPVNVSCDIERRVTREASSFGKLMYTEKFLFLLDHL